MSETVTFDFCIIPNPFSLGNRKLIFISAHNDLSVDVSNTVEYLEIKNMLSELGYFETNYMQFESSNNSDNLDKSIIELTELIESNGLFYSRELEVFVIKNLNSLKGEAEDRARELTNLSLGEVRPVKSDIVMSTRRELMKCKYIEPEINGKVTLYFYLFLELGFNKGGNPIIHFGGDFSDSSDYDNRNYIKIASSDFVRVYDSEKPDSFIFSSCKDHGDFLKETGFLYKGFFKYQKKVDDGDSKMIYETKYQYKIAEVKKFLNLEHPIVVETNRAGYDKLINLSNKIKLENSIESRKTILIDNIEKEVENLSDFLSDKMEILSSKDEFEEAAKMKSDLRLIKEKLSFVKKMDKEEITNKEYFKIFSII